MISGEHDHLDYLDAAYVLGALSPSERHEFERHLRTCSGCARSVGELAGLPGLLSRLDEEEVAALGDQPPVPPTVLPAVLAEVARRRHRQRVLSVAGALAAAAVVAVLTLVATGRLTGPDTGVAQPGTTSTVRPSTTTAMTQLGQYRLSADLGLQDVAWGTRMSVTCTYWGTSSNAANLPAYSLVVRTRSGREEQVATWRAVPGKATTIDAATAAPLSDIARVEVRTVQGQPVLRLVR